MDDQETGYDHNRYKQLLAAADMTRDLRVHQLWGMAALLLECAEHIFASPLPV